jgi:hypothetical protein
MAQKEKRRSACPSQKKTAQCVSIVRRSLILADRSRLSAKTTADADRHDAMPFLKLLQKLV